MSKKSLTPVNFCPVASLPVTASLGDGVYLTSDSKLYTWNGTTWDPVDAGGGGGSGLTHPQVMARAVFSGPF